MCRGTSGALGLTGVRVSAVVKIRPFAMNALISGAGWSWATGLNIV
jgi:hypothetical protein